MKNMRSYFSSWKPFWKSSTSSSQCQTLSLAPSAIHFTDSSLGDLKYSIIDENLMIDISRKLVESDCPPKLQICTHQNQWFALNNSHLLVYRQLERIGLCDSVGRVTINNTNLKKRKTIDNGLNLVCDVIRSEDIPIGIRRTLKPMRQITISETSSHDEVMYCADVQADSCGCLEDEEANDERLPINEESDRDVHSDDEQTGKINERSRRIFFSR